MAGDPEIRARFDALNTAKENLEAEYMAFCKARLPLRTRVRWVHSYERFTLKPVYRSGWVAGHPVYAWGRFEVVMHGKTAWHEKYAHELEII